MAVPIYGGLKYPLRKKTWADNSYYSDLEVTIYGQ